MKKICILSALAVLVGCTGLSAPGPDQLNQLTINVIYPAGYAAAVHAGAEVRAEEVSSGAAYRALTDRRGLAVMTVPDGIYRISLSDRVEKDVFNGTADKVVVTGGSRRVDLSLARSRAGTLVIKELYCGGCPRDPQEGTYQSDQYVILHNNDSRTLYLDSLCLGTLSPYNSTAVNHWITVDPETGETVYPAFAPIAQAVWQIGGDGTAFPLEPGEDAVICFRGAIDHTRQYPLSVDLNRSDYFVCYNPTYFPNTAYHPAPGDQIRPERILDVVIKTGQANAYTLSISSPTLVIFKASGTTIQEYAAGHVVQTPGSTADNVVQLPWEWIIDGIEVFDGRASSNAKRLLPSVDAGFAVQSDIYKGHTLMRRTDEEASAEGGYETLQDTNNSSNDFYERETQSLHS